MPLPRRAPAVATLALCLSALPGTARAQSPQDLVRWIYASRSQPGPMAGRGLDALAAPDARDRFLSARLAAFYAAAAAHDGALPPGAPGRCLDFAPDMDKQQFRPDEVARTLTVTAAEEPGRITVTATFQGRDGPSNVNYDFVAEDGAWRIDDVAGYGWRLSEIACPPAAAAADAAAPSAGPRAYCFAQGEDRLRLEVAADGSARFTLDSWGANGHSCAAAGAARPVNGGWLYEETISGTPCRLDIRVTADQGLTLADPGWACKETLCGARAVIDGLTFPRGSQVACAEAN